MEKWPSSLQIFSLVSLQLVRPFGLSKRPFFHEDLAFIVLSANSITSISNNVEHECLRFSHRIRVLGDLKGLLIGLYSLFSSFFMALRPGPRFGDPILWLDLVPDPSSLLLSPPILHNQLMLSKKGFGD